MSGSIYKKLFELKEAYYYQDVPVIIEKGVLYLDTRNRRVLAQLKMKNIGERPIKAVFVVFTCRDVENKVIVSSFEHQFLDLSVDRNESFGTKEAVYFDSNTIRSFNVRVSKVVLDDGTVVESSSDNEAAIPILNELESYKDSRELLKECKYREAENICCKSTDINELKTAASTYAGLGDYKDAQEKSNETLKKIEDINKKHKKKIILNITVPSSLIAVLICLSIFVIAPAIKYSSALSDLENNDNEEAISDLDSLGDFRDSVYLRSYAEYKSGNSEYLSEWVAKVSVNQSENSTKSQIHLDCSRDIYFHFVISGGDPKDETYLHFLIIYPNNTTDTSVSENMFSNGSSGWFSYNCDKNGTATLVIFDDDGCFMGSKSIEVSSDKDIQETE